MSNFIVNMWGIILCLFSIIIVVDSMEDIINLNLSETSNVIMLSLRLLLGIFTFLLGLLMVRLEDDKIKF